MWNKPGGLLVDDLVKRQRRPAFINVPVVAGEGYGGRCGVGAAPTGEPVSSDGVDQPAAEPLDLRRQLGTSGLEWTHCGEDGRGGIAVRRRGEDVTIPVTRRTRRAPRTAEDRGGECGEAWAWGRADASSMWTGPCGCTRAGETDTVGGHAMRRRCRGRPEVRTRRPADTGTGVSERQARHGGGGGVMLFTAPPSSPRRAIRGRGSAEQWDSVPVPVPGKCVRAATVRGRGTELSPEKWHCGLESLAVADARVPVVAAWSRPDGPRSRGWPAPVSLTVPEGSSLRFWAGIRSAWSSSAGTGSWRGSRI